MKRYLPQWLASLFLLALATIGCNDTEFASKQATKTTPTALNAEGSIIELFSASDGPKTPIDIVFVVDTSGSMREEQKRLRLNMANFISSFSQTGSHLDYQIFVIDQSFSIPAGMDSARIASVNAFVNSNNALSVLAQFLSGQFSSTLVRRSNAALEAVILTDDNAGRSYLVASTFRSLLQTQYPTLKFHLHGVVGLPSSINNTWCSVASVGSEYMTLGADPTYGGLILDICTEDWSGLLSRLGQQIATNNQQSTFVLKATPDLSKKREVYVNNRPLSPNEYQINAASRQLSFNPNVLTGNAQIKIIYTSK